MKKHYLLLIAFLCLSLMQSYAQQYTYTLVDNGAYSYTIEAVPTASASTFQTSVQSYGFTIIVPDGVTATLTSSLGGGASATFFDGMNVGDPSIDGYLITETLGSPVSLPSPSAATNSPMATIQINGTPTSGLIYILPNNSALANAVTPLKSFLQADMEDDGSAMFSNRIDPNASGTSGTSSYDFATLSVEENNELASLSLYPNPASDIVKVITPENISDIQIEMFDNGGKNIPVQLSEENTIDVSNIASGLYLITITSDDLKITKKLIVK